MDKSRGAFVYWVSYKGGSGDIILKVYDVSSGVIDESVASRVVWLLAVCCGYDRWGLPLRNCKDHGIGQI